MISLEKEPNKESNGGIPHQQIFEMNDYHKSKIFSDTDNTRLEDSLNFVKQGRRSIKRGGKSSDKDKKTILPVKIRGNYDRKSDDRSANRANYPKESTSLTRSKYQKHPMIINQMSDSKDVNKLNEFHCTDVLTPKSGLRDIKALKTTTSYYPNHPNNSKNIEDVNLPLFHIEKRNGCTKRKIAHEFNLKDERSNSSKPSPIFKPKYEIHTQKAYRGDLLIPRSHFQKDSTTSDSGSFVNPGRYKNGKTLHDKVKDSGQENKFAPHLYKKQKLVAGAIKIKTIERKYHKDFLDKRALN